MAPLRALRTMETDRDETLDSAAGSPVAVASPAIASVRAGRPAPVEPAVSPLRNSPPRTLAEPTRTSSV